MKATTEFVNQQYEDCYPDGIERHYWTFARHKIIERELKKLKNHGKVLDVGCGKGLTVNYLRERGFEAFGAELAHSNPPDSLKPYLKVGVDIFTLEPSFTNEINTLMLLDVIEHLPHPQEFLQRLKKEFKNLRYLIVTVPAGTALWSNYDEYYGHYRRYEFRSLKKELRALEGSFLNVQYFFHSLYLPAWMLKAFKVDRSTIIKAPKSSWIHMFLAYAFFIEYLLLPKRLLGSSLIATMDFSKL